jgi:hypothetical protein
MFDRFFSLMLAAGVALATPAVVRACAVCLTGANDPSADGYNASVLFLMATPYLVMGSIVGVLVVAYRRALKKRAKAESTESGIQLAWSQEESGR